jgi:hypothetical protein
VVPVVGTVVKAMSTAGVKLCALIWVDGPAEETANRWNNELTSLAVRGRLLRRLPENRLPNKGVIDNEQAERVYTWVVAEALRDFFLLKIGITGLLQWARLSLMKRYFSAH